MLVFIGIVPFDGYKLRIVKGKPSGSKALKVKFQGGNCAGEINDVTAAYDIDTIPFYYRFLDTTTSSFKDLTNLELHSLILNKRTDIFYLHGYSFRRFDSVSGLFFYGSVFIYSSRQFLYVDDVNKLYLIGVPSMIRDGSITDARITIVVWGDSIGTFCNESFGTEELQYYIPEHDNKNAIQVYVSNDAFWIDCYKIQRGTQNKTNTRALILCTRNKNTWGNGDTYYLKDFAYGSEELIKLEKYIKTSFNTQGYSTEEDKEAIKTLLNSPAMQRLGGREYYLKKLISEGIFKR